MPEITAATKLIARLLSRKLYVFVANKYTQKSVNSKVTIIINLFFIF